MERILVVEDDESTRDVLLEILKRWEYEVVEANNGKVALEKLENDKFSMVITDIRMPVMDGLTMLKEIKKKGLRMPVVVITGYPSVDSAVECLVEGADNYLVKPINLDDLQAKINKAFEKWRIQKTSDFLRILNIVLFALIPVWLGLGVLLARLM